ncbi:MAG: nucleotidyltransferase family protein [Candidatus Omnitrophica bacterium]|nr:nucleotidyltransferase family protein [Candidatus Omnitrophota bacterium]
MKVLILAAGYGTRLKELGENTPKALLPINDRPLLNYVLDKLQILEGLTEIIVVTNNKFFGHFEQWAQEQKDSCPHPITVVNDGTMTPEDRLGSIGDMDYVLKHHPVDEDLLVVGGDNLFDYNLDEYTRFAQSKGDAVTIGLYDIGNIEEARLFGVVAVDDHQKVVSFEEKPAKPKSSLVAMCFYYLPKNSLGLIGQYLVESQKSDKAGDYIIWLCKKFDVYGFKFTGKWYDIGSIEAYKEAADKFK